jgi:diguanylate cyclase (GGDEF)-like protein/PAS domain S-box-containing protein
VTSVDRSDAGRARAAIESLDGGYLVVRAVRAGAQVVDWEAIDGNALAWRLFTGTEGSKPGRRMFARLDEAHRVVMEPMLLDALTTGKRLEYRRPITWPDGTRTWRQLIAVGLDADVVALIGYDITAAVDTQSRVTALSEHSTDVVAIAGIDTGLQWVSPSVERVLGYTPSQLVGTCAANLIHPDDLPAIVAEFQRTDDESVNAVELRVRRDDGEYCWFECSATNRVDDPRIRGMVLTLRDVDARHRGAEQLRASETRIRSILDSAGDAIITVDESGVVEAFNRAAERIFGVAATEVIGLRYRELLPPGLSEQTRADLLRDSVSIEEPIEMVSIRATGEEFPAWISMSTAEIDGRVVHTAIIRDITKLKETERALEHKALYDDLTGLPNRRLLSDRIDEAIARGRRHGHSVGVMFLDLDRFKLVNDSLGHDIGDQLLVLVARRLKEVLASADTVARLGGDEFVVLCDELAGIDALSDLACAISETFRSPFTINDVEVFVTASIGIAVWDGGQASAIELLRNADTAMYRAKDHGRARFELFDERMQSLVAARLDMESALRHALNREELHAYYQPVVALATGRPTQLEALARWDRPERGLIDPAEFIDIAEDTGLILPIGEWMIRRAVQDCVGWQKLAPGVGVAINVSARQLVSGTFRETIERALTDFGLAPALLTLEITESVLLDDMEATLQLLNTLRARGVRIALDDFGTGYSSLTYLDRLPIDELKIDQSFVQSLDTQRPDRRLLETIIHLGQIFHVRVVAEGIDSTHKLNIIRQLGCHFGQGYLFADPSPLDAVLARFEGTPGQTASELRPS